MRCCLSICTRAHRCGAHNARTRVRHTQTANTLATDSAACRALARLGAIVVELNARLAFPAHEIRTIARRRARTVLLAGRARAQHRHSTRHQRPQRRRLGVDATIARLLQPQQDRCSRSANAQSRRRQRQQHGGVRSRVHERRRIRWHGICEQRIATARISQLQHKHVASCKLGAISVRPRDRKRRRAGRHARIDRRRRILGPNDFAGANDHVKQDEQDEEDKTLWRGIRGRQKD
jgi:hypothetical protein